MSFYTVTYVEVGPKLFAAGTAALASYCEAAGNDRGNAGIEILQRIDRANHFTTVEVWADRGASDGHAMLTPTRDFRTALASMTRALYDERLYKRLK